VDPLIRKVPRISNIEGKPANSATAMNAEDLRPNTIVRGPMFPEHVKVIRVVSMGGSLKLIGQGMTTGLVHQPILSPSQLASLEGSPQQEPFDGDATRFKLGVEALRLGIAYEYDPYFSLSIVRVDPLPHQLEAVYDYFLRLPRIRFVLADDPGAGKTIMAGLLIKELKVRGLDRTYLTRSLLELAGQVVCRLSGEKTETSAVFNLATQFGGGKTHALTLLYHLAKNGPKSHDWTGVRSILDKAGVSAIPEAAVAVFVGTEFDSITGRGGDDGTPLRKTPWGEIAWQLGGEAGFAAVAEHDRQFVEPKGDVIQARPSAGE